MSRPKSSASASRADLALLRLLRTHGHPPWAERLGLAFSRCGEHGALWHALAALGLAADPARRTVYLRAMRCVLAAYAANTVIKEVVRRRRPVIDGLPPLAPTISGHSYPSAHAAMSFAGARALPWPQLHTVAAAMALSRPYLGVHYPSDVAAGAALGDAVARLVP